MKEYQERDTITGRRKKKDLNPLNRKVLDMYEIDDYMVDGDTN